MNIGRYVTGFALAEVSGARPERLLSALAERGIPFWNAGPPEDFRLTVCVPLRAAGLIPPLAEALGCQGRILKRRGLPVLLLALRHRLVLALGLALGAALLFISGGFVWDIEISGNETIPEGVILEALSECGVDIGAFWPAFSQDQIRNSMILKLPGIRWMTVTIRGSHAEVIIRERRDYIEPVAEEEYANLVAVKAGLVTEVLALRGTAVTAVNRAVLPGDVLVAGYSTGRFGVQGPVRAIGSVTARTWYELTARSLTAVTEKGAEGDETVGWALILGKTRINFYKGSSICPAGCDKIISTWSLGAEGLFTLPLTVERAVYGAYDTVSVEALELREELEALLLETLEGQLSEGGSVVETSFTASQTDGVLTVTLRAECLEQIAKTVPLTEEELLEIQAKIPSTEETDS